MGTITEVITVDATAPKAFFEGLADALESFGKLADDEREHLPFRARHGLDILQRTCEEHLNGTAPAAAAGKGAAEPAYQGSVIIEWPDTQPGHHAIPSWRVTVYDVETGECINGSVSAARIDVDPAGWVTAELTQLISPDGQPVRNGVRDPVTGKIPPAVLWPDDDGRPRERTFRYLVSEMRVREVWKKPALCPCGSTRPEGYECRQPVLPPGSEPVTP